MTVRLTFVTALALFASVLGSVAADAASIDVGTLEGVRDLGPAPSSVAVKIAVVLQYRHQFELDRLTEAQADPGTTLFHRFLSPSQFRAYFALTPAEYARAVDALRRGGFTVARPAPNRSVIDAVAPAPVAARYFSTDIHRVLSPELGLTYTNVRPGIVPREIADLVQAVIGLDNAQVFRVPHRLQRSRLSAGVQLARANGYPLFGPQGGYGPQIFAWAYDLPSLEGYTGTGRSPGIEVPGDFQDSDITTYLSYFGVTYTGPPITRIAVDGGAPPFPGGAADEATGDVETMASLAPGAALYVYEFPALYGNYLIDMYNRVVSDNLVDSLNSSWFGCERQEHGQFAKSLEMIEQQGTAEGITFHSSSGDFGVYPFPCRKVSVAVPASTPHSVGVGGTQLVVDSNGHETNEVGWNVPNYGASGGGVSVFFKLPSYQRGVPNVIQSGRNVPDLAFDADAVTASAYYFDGSWSIFSGTSLASPIFGAALAEINQIEGARAGYFHVTLYKTWLENGYSSGSTLYVRDITQGSIPPYYARPGYDQMTGIGALQATNFAGLLRH